MKNLVIEKSSEATYDFINQFVNLDASETLVVATTNDFNISNHNGKIDAIVNLSLVNNIRRINKFFEKVNVKLEKKDTVWEKYQLLRAYILLLNLYFCVCFQKFGDSKKYILFLPEVEID